MQCTTLSGSRNGRTFVLEVSGETWDRFRAWRIALDSTTGALLAEIADSRDDPSAELTESDLNAYLDRLGPETSFTREVSAAFGHMRAFLAGRRLHKSGQK